MELERTNPYCSPNPYPSRLSPWFLTSPTSDIELYRPISAPCKIIFPDSRFRRNLEPVFLSQSNSTCGRLEWCRHFSHIHPIIPSSHHPIPTFSHLLPTLIDFCSSPLFDATTVLYLQTASCIRRLRPATCNLQPAHAYAPATKTHRRR